MPAARAWAAIATGSPPSLLASCQIHMPLPAKASGSVPRTRLSPAQARHRRDADADRVRAPARAVADRDRDGARRRPSRHARHVPDARVGHARGDRPARPPERHAHPAVQAPAAELELAADRRRGRRCGSSGSSPARSARASAEARGGGAPVRWLGRARTRVRAPPARCLSALPRRPRRHRTRGPRLSCCEVPRAHRPRARRRRDCAARRRRGRARLWARWRLRAPRRRAAAILGGRERRSRRIQRRVA